MPFNSIINENVPMCLVPLAITVLTTLASFNTDSENRKLYKSGINYPILNNCYH